MQPEMTREDLRRLRQRRRENKDRLAANWAVRKRTFADQFMRWLKETLKRAEQERYVKKHGWETPCNPK